MRFCSTKLREAVERCSSRRGARIQPRRMPRLRFRAQETRAGLLI